MNQIIVLLIFLVVIGFVLIAKNNTRSKFETSDDESGPDTNPEINDLYEFNRARVLESAGFNEDLLDPSKRYQIMKNLSGNSILASHQMLKNIFYLEMHYRNADGILEYFENLYLCGFLLYCIGSLDDVEMMWDAKHINMDTGSGFDIQYLVGSGVERTMKFCESIGRLDICEYLNSCIESGDFDYLESWSLGQIEHFGIDQDIMNAKHSKYHL